MITESEMNIIEQYRFGKMRINGKDYSSDLIIFFDTIETNWRRKKGHSLDGFRRHRLKSAVRCVALAASKAVSNISY